MSSTKKRWLSRTHSLHAGKRLAALPLRVPRRVYHASRMHYFPKMRGGHPTPARPSGAYIFITWLCSLLAIGLLYVVSHYTASPLIMAPFGATCVLLFGAPESPFAQPRNVIAGYVISTLLAITLAQFFGYDWWVAALSVATSIAIMQFTKTLHPPAGAVPLVVITSHALWSFALMPVLAGALLLVMCGVIANNAVKDRHYPKYWW